MNLESALWASSTAWTGKAAVALWTASILFQCLDARKITIRWQTLLSIFAMLCCLAAGRYASNSAMTGVWFASALLAGGNALLKIRQWLQTTPRQTFEEASRVDEPITKKLRNKKVSPHSKFSVIPASFIPANFEGFLQLAGWLTASVALAVSVHAALLSGKSATWLCMIHYLAACWLWGLAIFCAIELTFGSSPAALEAVSWSGAAAFALVCWLTEACIAAAIVLSPVDESREIQAVAMTRLFAVSILMMDYVVWMIPHRVAQFKRTGKATGWVSLTLAAMIGSISLGILCALPSDWPWKTL